MAPPFIFRRSLKILTLTVMLQFDATHPDVGYVNCAVCENAILSGRWFARLRHAERMIALCCPLCCETFESNPTPYMRRIETIEDMALRTSENLN